MNDLKQKVTGLTQAVNGQLTSKVKKIILGAVILGGAYYGYSMWMDAKMRGAHQMPATAVSVIEVSQKSVYPEASFVAKIEAQDKVGLRARVTGFLQERLFKEGDMVEKDQPLFIIESVNFEAKVREAAANLSQAEAKAVNARSQYDRTKTLFKTKDVSESKLDETRAAYDSANAVVAQMKASLDLAQKDLDYTTIKSPMSGKIGESLFSVGELIGPEAGVLAEIVKINPIDAVFSVSENQLLSLQQQFEATTAKSAKVRFFLSDGSEYPEAGTFSFVDNALDEAMNTLKLKASFPNPQNKLISGQYGRLVLTGSKTISDIVIPMRSIQRDMLGAFVYVVNKEGVIEKREVKTGTELPNFDIIVTDGLKVGEKVVIEGFQKIQPNMTVSAVVVPNEPAVENAPAQAVDAQASDEVVPEEVPVSHQEPATQALESMAHVGVDGSQNAIAEPRDGLADIAKPEQQ